MYSKKWHRQHGPARWHNAGAFRADDGRIYLCPVGAGAVVLPAISARLRDAWAPEAHHPTGLLATRTTDPEVVACWDVVEDRWQCVGLACRGVEIPQAVAAGQYAAADILAEPNSEVRSVMVLRYPGGFAAIAAELGLEPIQQDDYGRLYDVPGRACRYVEVVNATPEPDGTRKHHWLCVPPMTLTAREAAAWTFGATTREYDPRQES